MAVASWSSSLRVCNGDGGGKITPTEMSLELRGGAAEKHEHLNTGQRRPGHRTEDTGRTQAGSWLTPRATEHPDPRSNQSPPTHQAVRECALSHPA